MKDDLLLPILSLVCVFLWTRRKEGELKTWEGGRRRKRKGRGSLKEREKKEKRLA